MTDTTKQMWVKVKFAWDGETKSVPIERFWRFEEAFLPCVVKFDDGFMGYILKTGLPREWAEFDVMSPSGEFAKRTLRKKYVGGKVRVECLEINE